MPSPFTPSFASAASGTAANETNSNGRNPARVETGADWSRARTNGTTQTFRRPSLAANLSNQRDSGPNNLVNTPGTGVYVPPHLNSSYQSNANRNGAATENRYSKDQLLDLFRAQDRPGQANTNVTDLYVDGWNPMNGANNGGWGRKDETKDPSTGPEICWDYEGSVTPLATIEMGEDEKEAFVTSVNSPLKPPIQNSNKENPQNNGTIGRRTSLPQAQSGMSPYSGNLSSSRPGTRRRESSDFIPNNQLVSPTGNTRFSRDEPHISSPPPSLLRRRTDFKDNSAGTGLGDKDEDNEKSGLSPDSALPFGILKRTVTGPASAGTGSSSPWSGGPPSAGFAPMGAFGNFSLGGVSAQPFTPNEKKSAFGSTRGESRFKGLMNFDNSEENKLNVKEKASLNSLEQLAEASNEQPPLSWNTSREQRRDSRAFQDEEKFGAGSAALGGDDASPPRTHSSRTRNPDPQMSFDDIGFASLGLSDDVAPFRDMVQRRDQSQNTPQGRSQGTSQLNEPMSPTNTNPYQSPEGEKAIPEEIDLDDLNPPSHYIGARNFGHPGRGIHAPHDGASDRSQTSSAGASRAFPTLGPLGALSAIGPAGAWSNPPGAIGTPTRATPGYSSPFGDSIFSPSADIGLQNYNTTGTGSGFAGGTAGSAGPIGRGSKMGSLFPNAMQEQMREPLRQDQGSGDSMDIYQKNAAAAAANAPGFAAGLRETDSPIRSGRNPLDDLFANLDSRNRNAYPVPFSGSEPGPVASTQAQTSGPSQPTYSAAATFAGTPSLPTSNSGSYFSRNQDQETAASLASQLPASQQRQMVMPDRMRWIYRDPQGTTQGPWSGLEMHDWYKGGFFSPELQVKRVEDTEYEPLAQLIRRIGNSREPFLVPQKGIAHGSSVALPSSNASAAGAISTTTPAALQASAAQPPFASSFPSFGTTLTAEQQNALERRKQEEQYLMARQKEHLAQQQVMIKQMQQMQGVTHGLHNQQLHHHSSAHSLQSQPSYGSITSPTVYQPPSVGQGPKQPPAVPPFFDLIPRNSVPVPSLDSLGSGTLGSLREDDVAGIMDRLNRGTQQSTGAPAYIGGPQESLNHSQHIAAVMQERNRLQREQEHYDMLQRNSDDHRGTADRLEQYHLLRAMDEAPLYSQHGPIGGHVGPQSSDFEHSSSPLQGQDTSAEFRDLAQAIPTSIKAAEQLSLSEQVQKAAMAKQSPIIQAQSPWAKVDVGLPLPFPPPQSSSPLPAPAAQRKGQNVADTLTAESRSRSQTPLAETPSSALAPWAKDNMDSLKGPSLKEIQAMEAKKAAQQEEIAAAARRALAEQERHNQAAQPMAPAPGLPLSANWASGTSPATSTASGASAWTKPGGGKVPLAAVSTSTKKTLAQIQKEEEARKNRAAAAAAAASTASAAAFAAAVITPGGKRYADLASKAALSIPQNQSAAWTTVGAGGKVKTPIASTPVLTKPTASMPAQPTIAPPTKPKVTVPTRNAGAGGGAASNHQAALDEFQKWTKNAIGKGLNTGIPIDDFVSQLLILPAEPDIISDSIYASSQTLDGRRFAEEFVRRRKLADKGIIPDLSSGIGSATGSNFFSSPGSAADMKSGSGSGWLEVAKKGASGGGGGGAAAAVAKDAERESFRVVPGKKKGKRG